MILKIFLYTFLLCLCCCINSRTPCDKLSGKIVNQLAKEMQKEGLLTVGTGGGCNKDEEEKLNLIQIVFQYEKVLDIPTARRLMVTSASRLIALIEQNREGFDPSLSPLNMSLIFLTGQTSLAGEAEKIRGAQLIRGTIYYNIKNTALLPQKEGLPLTVHQETFEEAKEIVDRAAHTCDN